MLTGLHAGEHSIIMLRPLDSMMIQERKGLWLTPFVTDFRGRFMALLPGPFRGFGPALGLGLLDPQLSFSENETAAGIASGFTPGRGDGTLLSPYDMKRLQVSQCRLCGVVSISSIFSIGTLC